MPLSPFVTVSGCALCPHYQSEHDELWLGGGCRVRYYYGPVYERCQCPGFEPNEDEDDE